eukprot:6048220-Amphidinium_carterae.2
MRDMVCAIGGCLVLLEAHLAVASFTLSGLFFELLHNWWPNAQSHRLDNRPPVRPLQWLPFGPSQSRSDPSPEAK